MPIPMRELVAVVGKEKALQLVQQFDGAALPAFSAARRYCRDEEIKRLWDAGLELSDVAERLGVSYTTALRITKRQRQN